MVIEVKMLLLHPGFSVNNWIASKGFTATLSPLPDHLQMRVTEEHGIANMMKQRACNRMTDARYLPSSSMSNGWISGLRISFMDRCALTLP